MFNIPFWVNLPGQLAQDVAKNKQSPFVDLPGSRVAAKFDGKRRAAGAKPAVLRLVFVWRSSEQVSVFGSFKIVSAFGQTDLVLRFATGRHSLGEISHGVITEQHDRVASIVGNGGIRGATTGQHRHCGSAQNHGQDSQ